MTDVVEGRILAIDYGEVRIGLAISDPTRKFAFPLMVIDTKREKDWYGVIQKIIEDKQVKQVVMGCPVTLKGKESIQTEKVKKICCDLQEKMNIRVELWDERMTTTIAKKTLDFIGINSKKQRGIIDKMAAAYLLQNYLDTINKKVS